MATLIDLRRRLAVTSIVTTAARQHGLSEQITREVRRYAVNLLRQNVSASRAIHLAKHYAAVRAGHNQWPKGAA